MREPAGVVIADGEELRTDLRTLLIRDRGRTRELRLRIARGTIRDVDTDVEVSDDEQG